MPRKTIQQVKSDPVVAVKQEEAVILPEVKIEPITEAKIEAEESPIEEKINYILAVLTPRKIDNGNSIKYINKYYQPYLNDKLKCFMPKTKCLVIEAFDGSLVVTIDDHIYELKELSRNEKFSKEFDELPIVTKKEKYIPPMSHPWKLASFLKQMEKAHTNHVYA